MQDALFYELQIVHFFINKNIILFFIFRLRISSFNLHIPPYEALFESNVRHVYSANADSTNAKGANE